METHTWTLNASRFNVICLVCSKYHVGDDGIPTLMEDMIWNCGYTCLKASANEVVVCHNNIWCVHQNIWDLWYNSYSHSMGPQVDRILQKPFSMFPRLDSVATDNVVTFYDRLQEISMNHLLH
jgi:hypothetical protein